MACVGCFLTSLATPPTRVLERTKVLPMARYTGPKARINRRLGTLIYETAGATRALDRRPSPPGMHTRGRRPSNYGLALMEKQKIKHYYGLGERQLRRYFEAVGRKPGNTGELLLLMCERRLDNVVRRVGFTKTRPQARQGVVHGHFRVNGVKVTKPNFILRPGDIVEVRGRENLKNLYRGVIANATPDPLDWVTFDIENLKATVLGLPGASDISLPVDANNVVEFLSR
jgi:small subunit ribosomal protein S4